jgi:hypothetical protein
MYIANAVAVPKYSDHRVYIVCIGLGLRAQSFLSNHTTAAFTTTTTAFQQDRALLKSMRKLSFLKSCVVRFYSIGVGSRGRRIGSCCALLFYFFDDGRNKFVRPKFYECFRRWRRVDFELAAKGSNELAQLEIENESRRTVV